VNIVIRVAAFTAVLATYYGIAALLPEEHQSVAGMVAIGTVGVGEFLWGLRDRRVRDLPDGIRDWLVVAAVIAVFWWVTLLYFEGHDDVVTPLSDEFPSVLLTAALLFAPALVGLLLGRDSRG
jgi:hypothetical protein